jgi:hypothetical protein
MRVVANMSVVHAVRTAVRELFSVRDTREKLFGLNLAWLVLKLAGLMRGVSKCVSQTCCVVGWPGR